MNAQGQISPEELKEAIRPETILVSVMFVNNEIGAVEPIAEIGELIKQVNPKTYFHVDAIQASANTGFIRNGWASTCSP